MKKACKNLLLRIVTASIIFFSIANSAHAQQGTYALKFNGAYGEYVDLPDMEIGGDLTIEAWVFLNNYSNWQRIIEFATSGGGRTDNIVFGFAGGSSDLFYETNEGWEQIGYIEASAIPLNQWVHVAVVQSVGIATLFYNGTAVTSQGQTPAVKRTRNDVWIGKSHFPDPYLFGMVDELRVWTVARTEAQIKANLYRELDPLDNVGLLAYYKMSDGSETSLTDNSGNGYNGTLTNGPEWKASGCFAGPQQALDFDGTDDYVNLGDVIESFTTYTTEAWVYWRGPGQTYSEMCSKEKVVSFAIRDQGSGIYKMACNFGNGSSWGTEVISTTSIPTNQWVHLAATRDGPGNVHLYINGIQDASTVVNSSSGGNTENRGIGTKPVGAGIEGPFNGRIDEVRMWNTARTADQIREDMMCTLAGNETGLMAYYRMDYRDGNTLYDNSNNVIPLNGTLTNMSSPSCWVTSSAFNTWIGSESSNWSTATNWGSSTTPVSTDNVGLYKWNALANENTISGSPTVNSLLISSTSSPTVSSNFTASGNVFLENNLTLYGGNTLTTVGSLVVESGKTLTIPATGQLTVSGTLTNNAGNTGLVINSDATGTGSLIQSSSSIGATIKRYITGSTNLEDMKYHLVSIPLNSGSPTSNLFLGSYLYDLDATQENSTNNYGKWISLGTPTGNSNQYSFKPD